MNHIKVNYYKGNTINEASHFLLRPQSPGVSKCFSFSSALEGKSSRPHFDSWTHEAFRSPAGGDLRVKNFYPNRENTSSRPEFGSKFIKGLRTIF